MNRSKRYCPNCNSYCPVGWEFCSQCEIKLPDATFDQAIEQVNLDDELSEVLSELGEELGIPGLTWQEHQGGCLEKYHLKLTKIATKDYNNQIKIMRMFSEIAREKGREPKQAYPPQKNKKENTVLIVGKNFKIKSHIRVVLRNRLFPYKILFSIFS